MLLLIVVLFCMLSYKLLTKWIWVILPFAIIYDLGLWIVSHLLVTSVIILIGLELYDQLVYRRHHNHSLFGPTDQN
ncbi:hypothetical protein [Lentilactobacillus sp. SPB1-3]|uniref:Uncharacterized protein n=1 Tax=Lentilactobacillus terminaliae TaxID=3003483 RepID=A0ACD5DFA1_9LACO|nr:hypothetical protein [Lentilactobacillus sp. SPB1-3]MCZ0976418.1 hypothetical protein [Lentilactobacillus sp. SPB1-3]